MWIGVVVIQLLNVSLAQRLVEDIDFVNQAVQIGLPIAFACAATANVELPARSQWHSNYRRYNQCAKNASTLPSKYSVLVVPSQTITT